MIMEHFCSGTIKFLYLPEVCIELYHSEVAFLSNKNARIHNPLLSLAEEIYEKSKTTRKDLNLSLRNKAVRFHTRQKMTD